VITKAQYPPASKVIGEFQRTSKSRNVGMGSEGQLAREDGGLQYFWIYELRHTLASRLTQAGVSPLFVAQIIGDSGTRILNTYVSAIDEYWVRELRLRSNDPSRGRSRAVHLGREFSKPASQPGPGEEFDQLGDHFGYAGYRTNDGGVTSSFVPPEAGRLS